MSFLEKLKAEAESMFGKFKAIPSLTTKISIVVGVLFALYFIINILPMLLLAIAFIGLFWIVYAAIQRDES